MAGLDLNTKLYLPFDQNTLGATTKDGALEILDYGNTGHIVLPYYQATLSTTYTKFGDTSLYMQGAGDQSQLRIPDSSDWDIFGSITQDYTIDTFIKLGVANNGPAVLTHYQHTTYKWTIGYTTSQGFYLGLKWNNAWTLSTKGGVVSDTDWHHLAMCKVTDGGSTVLFGLYLDGIQVAYLSHATARALHGILYINDTPEGGGPANGCYYEQLRISTSNIFGASPNATPDDDISGSIPEGASDYVVDEDTKLYLPMTTQDQSGDGGSDAYHLPDFIGTAQLDTAVTKYGTDTSSLLLDGNSDYVTLPDSADWDVCSDTTTDQTVDFWIKHATGTWNTNEFQLCQYESDNDRWMIFYSTTVGTKGFAFYFRTGGSYTIALTMNTEFADTNFHHVAFIKKGGVSSAEYAMYVDGIQYSYLDDNSTDTLAGVLNIGNYKTGGPSTAYTNGNMAHTRIQASNIFGASPNVGKTDTITVPTAPYTYAASALEISVSESVTIAESQSLTIPPIDVSEFESVSIAENIALLLPTLILSTSDSVTIAEDVERNLVCNLSTFDSVSIAEDIERQLICNLTVTDSISISDNIETDISGILKFESISIAENIECQIAYKLTITDSISISENIKRDRVCIISISDSISISENITLVMLLNVYEFDSISVTEYEFEYMILATYDFQNITSELNFEDVTEQLSFINQT